MSARHTPGPWFIEETPESDSGSFLIISDGAPEWIVAETARGIPGNPDEANARLIAAAPDLLAALKAAVDCGMVPTSSVSDGGAAKYVHQVAVADMIRAAIAKAEGTP